MAATREMMNHDWCWRAGCLHQMDEAIINDVLDIFQHRTSTSLVMPDTFHQYVRFVPHKLVNATTTPR